MNRYFLRIAYDGTHFHGWQSQDNAHSVQDELNRALSVFLQEDIKSTGCGRTDTGVHAMYFILHFDCSKTIINHKQFLFKLNRILPESIAAYSLYKVNEGVHARFDAVSRTYNYYITQAKDPFMTRSAWFIYGTLDLDKMNAASAILLNYSDFSAFSKSGSDNDTSLCKLTEAFWEQEENLLTFTITANRFLRNMVRAIVGTIVEIGQGKKEVEYMHLLIQSGKRENAGASAPAHGLFLTDVRYGEGVINE